MNSTKRSIYSDSKINQEDCCNYLYSIVMTVVEFGGLGKIKEPNQTFSKDVLMY